MKLLALLATTIGVLTVSAGAALVYLPAGVILLGASLATAGLFAIDVGRK